MKPAKIIALDTILMKNQFGSYYAQDIATMDDGSKWEIPCVGNGQIWKQISKSIPELQVEFERMYTTLHTAAIIRNGHGKKAIKAKEAGGDTDRGTRSGRRD